MPGEAEFNGGVATSEGIFYKEVFDFFRIPLTRARPVEYTNARESGKRATWTQNRCGFSRA